MLSIQIEVSTSRNFSKSQISKKSELATVADMQKISRKIADICDGFQSAHVAQSYVWRSLRKLTNTPTPQRFPVSTLPLVYKELEELHTDFIQFLIDSAHIEKSYLSLICN